MLPRAQKPGTRPKKKRRRARPEKAVESRRSANGSSGSTDGTGKPGSLRRCIVSRAVRPKDRLLRFTLDGGGNVAFDVDGRRGGRGLWLSPRRDMVNTACARKLFARAARAPVTAPADIGDRAESLLVRRCLDLIGLAQRAGQVAVGFDEACAWLRAGKAAAAVVSASDGLPEEMAVMRDIAPGVPFLYLFDRGELAAALGRDEAVHVVVAPGRLADRLVREGFRLAGLGRTDAEPEGDSDCPSDH